MKISVVVIAHNEEPWIERCLTSLLQQTQKPDEIILVAHNCTDKTIEIAEQFSEVKIVLCTEQGGSIISRARGIEATTGNIVCCTDGDCWADKEWVKHVSAPLMHNEKISIVAGYTKILNGWFWSFSCWYQFFLNRKLLNKKAQRFAWGSNFAFRKADYETVGGLMPFVQIKKDLNLNYDAEDLYISLALQKIGKIFFALDAKMYTYLPGEKASVEAQKNIVPKQQQDNKKLFKYFDF